jgi:DNA polymerase II small subunit/DNA polymerase delta subunit B|tara:strand:+ start:1100 stop:1507 length:408 start_codon:yes stop_codon:yes gene_type:complete
MKTIFDYLRDLLFTKDGKSMSNIDDEDGYNTYMINRWVSMYSPSIAILINETTNRYWSLFSKKRDCYNFLHKMLPQVPNRRIYYIKKQKMDKSQDMEIIGMIAKNMELSKREITYYIETTNTNLDKFKDYGKTNR